MSDPARIEELGAGLAAVTRELAPTRVLCWEGIEDRLLAHIVARELRRSAEHPVVLAPSGTVR